MSVCLCVCVLLVSSTSNIAFNSSTNAITVDNLLAKDIDQYFKTELNVSLINFMISMRSFSFLKITIRLSKIVRTEDGAHTFFTKLCNA